MKSMKWWMLPVAIGIPVGLLLGIMACATSPQWQFYAHYRFMRLLTAVLARQVDWHALIITVCLAVIVLGVVASRRLPLALMVLLRGVLPLAALAGAAKILLPPLQWIWLGHLLINPGVWTYAGLLVALGVLIVILRRLRREHSPILPDAYASSPRRSPVVAILGTVAMWGIRLCLLLFLAVNLAAAGWWIGSLLHTQSQPNVILIMVCSLRADHLGCYGYDLPTTPHLDRFASKSTRFAHAVSPSSWTLWSTASVLTSRYPERIFHNTDYVAEHAYYPGMPTVLSDMGYATRAVTAHPFMHNTDSFNYPQDFDSFVKLGDGGFVDNLAPTVTARALQYATRQQGRPFFLYMMFEDPHMPYTQHPEFRFGPSRKDRLAPEWLSSLPPADRNMTPSRMQRLLGMTPGDSNEIGEGRQLRLAKYNSEIAYTDQAIGAFLDGLKQRGLYDNSMIIFCGDHGEEFLEHGRYGHFNTLYPEVVNVPLLVKAPHQQTGKIVDGRFPLIDLFPSVLTTLHRDNRKLQLHGDGVDVATLLRCSDKPVYGATIYSARSVTAGHLRYYCGVRIDPIGNDLIEGELHVQMSNPITRLFDLEKDPGMYCDLLPGAHDAGGALEEFLRKHDRELDAIGDILSPSLLSTNSETERAREKLRSLGYMQ